MKKEIVLYSLLCFFIIIFTYSIVNIIAWENDNEDTEEVTKIINNVVNVEEIEDSPKTEIIKPENIYTKYQKMKLINVNIEELKTINSNTIGWIQVLGTKVNYPFVQVDNNSYYLKHSFDNKKNSAGWIFLDYRNNIDQLDKNTIIYGHGRIDNTMFGSLRPIESNGWLNNDDNFIIKISTDKENTMWQIFSIYTIPTTSDYLNIEFDDNSFIDFINLITTRSSFNFNTTITNDDKIITLSTCYDETNKTVIHAKLIKKEIR